MRPGRGNASLGNSFQGDLRCRFGIGRAGRRNSRDDDVGNPEPTAAQDPIEWQRVRRRYLVVLAAS